MGRQVGWWGFTKLSYGLKLLCMTSQGLGETFQVDFTDMYSAWTSGVDKGA